MPKHDKKSDEKLDDAGKIKLAIVEVDNYLKHLGEVLKSMDLKLSQGEGQVIEQMIAKDYKEGELLSYSKKIDENLNSLIRTLRKQDLPELKIMADKLEKTKNLKTTLRNDEADDDREVISGVKDWINENKKENSKFTQHRNRYSTKAENMLRVFTAFVATMTGIFAPVVYHQRKKILKRTEGEHMIERLDRILKKP